MNCPKCNKDNTRIVDTRELSDEVQENTRYRKYKCSDCGAVFYTKETLCAEHIGRRAINLAIRKVKEKNNG